MALKEFRMQLLGDLVAVLPESVRPTGTIILPDWQRSLTGSVLACGPDCKELKKGDRVQFGAASGMESVFSGAAIRIMSEQKDVLCVYDR